MVEELEYVDVDEARPRGRYGRSYGEDRFWQDLDDEWFNVDELLEKPDPIGAAIAQQRDRLKRQIVDLVDGLCEFCDTVGGALDLHEVFVPRSKVPRVRQLEIMVISNCGLACRACHDGLHGKWSRERIEEQRARFQRRRERMGYDVGRFRTARG